LTDTPLTGATCFLDNAPIENGRYVVSYGDSPIEPRPSSGSQVWRDGFLSIPIKPIDGYRLGDASVADLDGDGELDVVVHQVSRGRDNSHSGITGTPILDAYRMDGTHLWRIDLGKNIREGEHYTQFLVYDFDGDGKAELLCKTADGSRDGAGEWIGDPQADFRELDERSKRFGRVLAGPEFLTMFDGRTGRALQTVDYLPSREPINGWGGIGGNGGNDDYGNRCDRFLACVAYLDGERPSAVMCRGVYGRIVLVAWDWREGGLAHRWTFDSKSSQPPYDDASKYSGMGGHSLSVADVDFDGRDEIVYQAMVVDDNGQGLHSSGLRHGDSMHVGDLNPLRPGLEVFTVQENEDDTVRWKTPGVALRDAMTGEILWSALPGEDVPAGVAADIDPRHAGYEVWSRPGGLRTVTGETLGTAPRSTEFTLWWDGDRLRELFSGAGVTKWNWETSTEELLFPIEHSRGRGGGRWPCLSGDLLGDWREELLLPAPDGRSLRLYTTNLPTVHRLTTLLHDRQYRLGLAWQNVVYNKPPHPSFFFGEPVVTP
jgi:rhamnogalacturonan endolyase